MRIMTVRQPWAWAIIHGGKDVENRVRNIAGAYRGPVAIHAGLSIDIEAFRISDRDGGPLHSALQRGSGALRAKGWDVGIPPWRTWLGHIIGVVDLVDVHRPMWDDTCSADDGGTCSLWAEVNGWPQHLVLANPRPLPQPMPYRGALGLRHLDEDATARLLKGLE